MLTSSKIRDLKDNPSAIFQTESLRNASTRHTNARYRVVLFRPNFNNIFKYFEPEAGPGAPSVIPGLLESIKKDFYKINGVDIDVISPEYVKLVQDYSSSKDRFLIFMDAYKKAVQGLIEASEKVYAGDALFREVISEYDITPLVTGLDISSSLDDVNTCNISAINPTFVSFDTDMVRKHAQIAGWANSFTSNKSAALNELDRLRSLRITEYDLIRVYIDSGRGELDSAGGPSSKDALSTSGLDIHFSEEYKSRMSYGVAFTGVVKTVSHTNSADNPYNMVISCLSMSRVLQDSSMVVDQSLLSVLEFKNPGIAGQAAGTPRAMTGTFYEGKTPGEVFLHLMSRYFYPIGSTEGKEVSVISPAIVDSGVGKTSSLETIVSTSVGIANVSELIKKDGIIPFFNMLLCYQAVKQFGVEPIYYMSDYHYAALSQDNTVAAMGGTEGSTDGILSQSFSVYLLTLKNGMALLDATYKSPYSMLGDIRENTFMEVFEDRTGTFQMRFPRYNTTMVSRRLGHSDILSAVLNISDSTNRNVVNTSWMAQIINSIDPAPAESFLDIISVFKHGFRVTENIKNPNALTQQTTKMLAEFYRFNFLYKNCRTATVTCLGDVLVSPGQMVSFVLGFPAALGADGEMNKYRGSGVVGGGASEYVGYVSSVSDSFSADGNYTQTLNLTHVRELYDYEIRKSAIVVIEPININALGTDVSATYYYKGKEAVVTGDKDSDPAKNTYSNSTRFTESRNVLYRHVMKSQCIGSFQGVADVRALASKMSIGNSMASTNTRLPSTGDKEYTSKDMSSSDAVVVKKANALYLLYRFMVVLWKVNICLGIREKLLALIKNPGTKGLVTYSSLRTRFKEILKELDAAGAKRLSTIHAARWSVDLILNPGVVINASVAPISTTDNSPTPRGGMAVQVATAVVGEIAGVGSSSLGFVKTNNRALEKLVGRMKEDETAWDPGFGSKPDFRAGKGDSQNPIQFSYSSADIMPILQYTPPDYGTYWPPRKSTVLDMSNMIAAALDAKDGTQGDLDTIKRNIDTFLFEYARLMRDKMIAVIDHVNALTVVDGKSLVDVQSDLEDAIRFAKDPRTTTDKVVDTTVKVSGDVAKSLGEALTDFTTVTVTSGGVKTKYSLFNGISEVLDEVPVPPDYKPPFLPKP